MSTAVRTSAHWQTLRKVLQIGGLICGCFWLLMVGFELHGLGFAAIFQAASFLLLLLIPTMLTRTIPLKSVYAMFITGAFLMYVARFLFGGLDAIGIHYGTFWRSFIVPPVEQLLIIAPVVAFLWFERGFATRLMGVSDVAIMAAAYGTGFWLVESIKAQDWLSQSFTVVTWYPNYGNHACAGYGIWAALVGVSLGVATLFWCKQKWTKIFVQLMFGLVVVDQFIDHFNACNMYGREGNAICFTLDWLYGGGWHIPRLFLVVFALGFLLDLYVLSKFSLIWFSEAQSPSSSLFAARGNWSELKKTWDYVLWIRRAAYLDFRSRFADETFRTQAANLRRLILKVLDSWNTTERVAKEPSIRNSAGIS
jgi:hypothetical protein